MGYENKHDDLATALEVSPEYEPLPASALRERLDAVTDEDTEYQIARASMIEIMKTGADAMQELQSLAGQTQSARYFEALTELMKTMIQGNKDMMEMKKLDLEINQPADPKDITPHNNIVMVGSTAELMQMIAEKRKSGT